MGIDNILALVITVTFTGMLLFYAITAGRAKISLRTPENAVWMDRLAGIMLLGVALVVLFVP